MSLSNISNNENNWIPVEESTNFETVLKSCGFLEVEPVDVDRTKPKLASSVSKATGVNRSLKVAKVEVRIPRFLVERSDSGDTGK